MTAITGVPSAEVPSCFLCEATEAPDVPMSGAELAVMACVDEGECLKRSRKRSAAMLSNLAAKAGSR